MRDPAKRAEILMEALPYIKSYHGRTVVIKYGGKAMTNSSIKDSIASDLVLMKYVGINPVVVHGGGQEISGYMTKLGLEVEFVGGLRRTSREAMDVVKMVLVGKVNQELVALINGHGRLAVGLSGDDAKLLTAVKKVGLPDLGYVGEVTSVNAKLLNDLIGDGFVPVVATIGAGEDGQSYNINADTAAGEIAAAIGADKIIFLTDVEGLYRDSRDPATLMSEITLERGLEMVEKGHLDGGMAPKVEAMTTALQAGVKRAHILNGTVPHALLLEIFTDEGIGTMINGPEPEVDR